MRSPISIILVAVSCCLLGAVTTIGIAIAAAWRVQPEGRLTGVVLSEAGRPWAAEARRQAFVERWLVGPQRSLALPIAPVAQIDRPSWLVLPDESDVSSWAKLEVIAAGWPLRCLRAQSSFDVLSFTPTAAVWQSGYVIRQGSAVIPFTATVLPLGFIWPGTVVDTLLFAAGWFLVGAGVFVLRSRIRHARGQCGSCGYDLRGSASGQCPECGAPTPRKLTTAPK
jgi:hypothetical protein